MTHPNGFYAQSGGVTAVINASAAGVLKAWRQSPDVGTLYMGQNGILGALEENLLDTTNLTEADIEGLKYTPGGAFGSCRYKLPSLTDNAADYHRLIEVFKAHHIRYFFYNGGGDSQDTAWKVAQLSQEMGYPIQCIGIPKTVDNDLPFTDCSPGFGSVAKYVAISTLEASLDVASMSASSTKVFIHEVMGRHAGWIAASAGLIKNQPSDPPHLILIPEQPFDLERTMTAVDHAVKTHGFCTIVVSEGLRLPTGQFFSEAGGEDAFGHKQLGGVAPKLAQLIKERLGYKYHWAVSDYLQRSARHIASDTDVKQAYAVGESAVQLALNGESGVMPVIVRDTDEPYTWHLETAPLSDIANVEKTLPEHFYDADNFEITAAAKTYFRPLIQGESYPHYKHGLPQYQRIQCPLAKKCCPPWKK